MESSYLCSSWKSQLESWAIPEEIISTAPESPWKLHPEKFAPDTLRSGTLTMKILKSLLDVDNGPGRTLVDVGCGAGGLSVPLLGHVTQLCAVDASEGMLDAFRAQFEQSSSGSSKLRLVLGKWEEVARSLGTYDVVLCANVLFNVPDICEFIRALDVAANRGVVIEIHEKHPHSVANEAWKHFWGLERPAGPIGTDVLEIIESLGIHPLSEVYMRDEGGSVPIDDEFVRSIRQRICLDASRDGEIREFLLANPVERIPTRLIWWMKDDGEVAS